MPEILVVQGKNKGERYRLAADSISIGRESANEIALNDASISRRHCLIEKRSDRFFISDNQSLNGTSVNDSKADDTLLRHNDRIRVGDYLLAFLDDENASLSGTIRFDESRVDLTKTVHLSIEEVVRTMARDLAALLVISEKINSVSDLNEFRQTLLKQIFEVVPANEAAILFLNDDDSDFSETHACGRDDEIAEISISRTIVSRVTTTQEAILASEIGQDENLKAAESLFIAQTSSVLCVPLILFGKTLGVIYLAANKTAARFDESHLRFMTAVANIAAVAIENLRNLEFLRRENARLREETFSSHHLLGESKAMKKVTSIIMRVAPTDSTVLITGESGTGKELAARAIHLSSRRREKPFVAVNCAALTETLLESELFGHEKGAFTGAIAAKPGKIELAQNGTLFLDEIGEIPVHLQAKLLRVLQEREYERVGGIKKLKADVRLIAATNRHLETDIKNGKFREDLFYRLNVISFKMPRLTEREQDILILADNFAAKYAAKSNRRIRGISAKAKKLLLGYDFPGNVRELENAVERAVVLGVDEWLLPEDLPEGFQEAAENSMNEEAPENRYHEALQAKKKELIFQAFAEARGSYVETARILDVHPNYLHRLIRNLNIKQQLDEKLTA